MRQFLTPQSHAASLKKIQKKNSKKKNSKKKKEKAKKLLPGRRDVGAVQGLCVRRRLLLPASVCCLLCANLSLRSFAAKNFCPRAVSASPRRHAALSLPAHFPRAVAAASATGGTAKAPSKWGTPGGKGGAGASAAVRRKYSAPPLSPLFLSRAVRLLTLAFAPPLPPLLRAGRRACCCTCRRRRRL
jgi:hypothetical protein